jgi:hypothetical protein
MYTIVAKVFVRCAANASVVGCKRDRERTDEGGKKVQDKCAGRLEF